MFGCSDVCHWMSRTAKAVCLPDLDVLALKSHNLDATTFCAASSRTVRGKRYTLTRLVEASGPGCPTRRTSRHR
jgi:hypothetical protein